MYCIHPSTKLLSFFFSSEKLVLFLQCWSLHVSSRKNAAKQRYTNRYTIRENVRSRFKAMINIHGTALYLALYTDVTNSKELLESMQAGTLEPEVALLNASLIPDIFPVLAAAHKTLEAKSRDSLTTRTLHSELVYNYSGSKHITESLKRCGVSENTAYILVVRFDATPDEIKAIEKLVIGKEISVEELEGRANQSQIQKQYKISASELGVSSLADAITC
ncbi:uncharacterized protein [Cicer arietinum]|uniref:EKC/KEOPS complex subunit TPRKB-like n=1 Tax=Cicer arietinum TaxID=3827 RepID=A0A3Q7XPB6_CICAR|nr:EKC/KEOPS complex subunit TPRKB-like [Cicer arietinum]